MGEPGAKVGAGREQRARQRADAARLGEGREPQLLQVIEIIEGAGQRQFLHRRPAGGARAGGEVGEDTRPFAIEDQRPLDRRRSRRSEAGRIAGREISKPPVRRQQDETQFLDAFRRPRSGSEPFDQSKRGRRGQFAVADEEIGRIRPVAIAPEAMGALRVDEQVVCRADDIRCERAAARLRPDGRRGEQQGEKNEDEAGQAPHGVTGDGARAG
jgi:hypothetical protein